MRIYDPNCFDARVALAEKYIREGKEPDRLMATCFEMNDGEQVALALMNKAQSDPVLHDAIKEAAGSSYESMWLEPFARQAHAVH